MLEGSKVITTNLDEQTKKWIEMIDKAMLYNKMGDFEKATFDMLQKLNEFSSNKDAEKLAQTFVDSLQLIKKSKIESEQQKITIDESAKFNIHALELKSRLEDIITQFCKDDINMLLNVSYELLKL